MRFLGYLFVCFAILFVDFTSKLLVMHFMPGAVVINYGVSWGIGSLGPSSGFVFGVVATVVAIAFLLYARRRFLRGFGVLPEVMIASGALGNVIDRIMNHGGVIDFIDVSRLGISFPIFNFADIAVVVGVFFLLVREYWYDTV